MPKIQRVDFRAIKAAITMEQLLEHYGLINKFKRGKDSLSGPCPIHKGTNPTQFRVSISKNLWNCFSECHHGGNPLDFIAKMEDISIHAAALKAIEWFGLDPEGMAANPAEPEAQPLREAYKRPESARQSEPEPAKPNPPLKFRLDKLERDHPYLAERGLTPETVVDFGIGFCTKGVMQGHIAIPIHNVKGEVVAYAGRWPGEPPEDTQKYKLPKGFAKSQEVYNLDRAIKEPVEKPLVIVEGFFDCIKLWQLGVKKVVALMGSTLCPSQEELIRQHTNSESQIIVMFDENEAGRIGREDAAARLSTFAFVKTHVFEQEDMEPEHLTAEQVAFLNA
jgi:DNA primase